MIFFAVLGVLTAVVLGVIGLATVMEKALKE